MNKYKNIGKNFLIAILMKTKLLKSKNPDFISVWEILFVFATGRTNSVPILDGKYVVLPSGELQIRNVTAEDGFKTYKCRTKHRLTGMLGENT